MDASDVDRILGIISPAFSASKHPIADQAGPKFRSKQPTASETANGHFPPFSSPDAGMPRSFLDRQDWLAQEYSTTIPASELDLYQSALVRQIENSATSKALQLPVGRFGLGSRSDSSSLSVSSLESSFSGGSLTSSSTATSAPGIEPKDLAFVWSGRCNCKPQPKCPGVVCTMERALLSCCDRQKMAGSCHEQKSKPALPPKTGKHKPSIRKWVIEVLHSISWGTAAHDHGEEAMMKNFWPLAMDSVQAAEARRQNKVNSSEKAIAELDSLMGWMLPISTFRDPHLWLRIDYIQRVCLTLDVPHEWWGQVLVAAMEGDYEDLARMCIDDSLSWAQILVELFYELSGCAHMAMTFGLLKLAGDYVFATDTPQAVISKIRYGVLACPRFLSATEGLMDIVKLYIQTYLPTLAYRLGDEFEKMRTKVRVIHPDVAYAMVAAWLEDVGRKDLRHEVTKPKGEYTPVVPRRWFSLKCYQP